MAIVKYCPKHHKVNWFGLWLDFNNELSNHLEIIIDDSGNYTFKFHPCWRCRMEKLIRLIQPILLMILITGEVLFFPDSIDMNP